MLELYTTPLSANGRKVLAVAHQLGLEVQIHDVNVYRGEGAQPEYRALHPQGKIPLLRDGAFLLRESNAIAVYLAEGHGDYRLWSREPALRARMSAWLFWESAHWQPTLGRILGPHVAHRLGIPGFAPPTAEPAWQDAELRRQLSLLEGSLAGHAFLMGDAPTLPDLCVAAMTTYFAATHFPFEDHSILDGWCQRMGELASWRATAAPLWSDP